MASRPLRSHPRDAPAGAPEVGVAVDLLRRGLPAAPVALVLAGGFWGLDGALSAGFGLVLVAANFLASANLIAAAARRSPTTLMAAALGGFVVRLGVLVGIVSLVQDLAWVELTPLLFTVLVAHLGLLTWETRYVSLSLAYPGLRPAGSRPHAGGSS
jgi:hypothetical protein